MSRAGSGLLTTCIATSVKTLLNYLLQSAKQSRAFQITSADFTVKLSRGGRRWPEVAGGIGFKCHLDSR